MANATVVTIFHRTPDIATFLAWADEIGRAAKKFDGFVDAHTAAYETASLDWAASVRFDDEAALNAWLDSAARREVIAAGASRGFLSANADLILIPGCLPPGTAVFSHAVAPGREEHFEEVQTRLAAQISDFPGAQGVAVLGPRDDGRWFAVLRFRTDRQLADWLSSRERSEALPELRSELTEDFEVLVSSTPFGSILRFTNGKAQVTPRWKTGMLILLVLYPTVMTLSRFVSPVLVDHGAPIWLSTWLSEIVSVGLLTGVLMPFATRRFRIWLDPVDGSGLKVTVVGIAIVVVAYAATLALFASVRWLQFWDYPR
jgi:uncharacterized protein